MGNFWRDIWINWASWLAKTNQAASLTNQDCLSNISGYKQTRWLWHISFERCTMSFFFPFFYEVVPKPPDQPKQIRQLRKGSFLICFGQSAGLFHSNVPPEILHDISLLWRSELSLWRYLQNNNDISLKLDFWYILNIFT